MVVPCWGTGITKWIIHSGLFASATATDCSHRSFFPGRLLKKMQLHFPANANGNANPNANAVVEMRLESAIAVIKVRLIFGLKCLSADQHREMHWETSARGWMFIFNGKYCPSGQKFSPKQQLLAGLLIPDKWDQWFSFPSLSQKVSPCPKRMLPSFSFLTLSSHPDIKFCPIELAKRG